MEIYEEMRNLDGHDSQGSSQELGDDITGCSRPGSLTSCWTERGKPGNLDQFLKLLFLHSLTPKYPQD